MRHEPWQGTLADWWAASPAVPMAEEYGPETVRDLMRLMKRRHAEIARATHHDLPDEVRAELVTDGCLWARRPDA